MRWRASRRMLAGRAQVRLDVLFWRSLFGLGPQPLGDLPDPYGLVQSRALVSPAGTLRLTFNIFEAREVATNRFIS